jgi:hypothetical protein
MYIYTSSTESTSGAIYTTRRTSSPDVIPSTWANYSGS